jgi:CDP-glycerol glycerophosphotransferase (TagB/SpsB family)
MVFSYYLLKYPYKLIWNSIPQNSKQYLLYCADYLDYIIFNPVQKYLKPVQLLASDTKIKADLYKNGLNSTLYPAFPKAVFMCRHACYKFPEKKILKFGFRHGAYHFKKLTNPDNYNAFDVFFVTSSAEVDLAKKSGIRSCQAIGYPKLDPAFNGTYNQDFLQNFKNAINLDNSKQTVLFTATWDKSGMSAIDKWIKILPLISKSYNVLVTVHPWTSPHYKNHLRSLDQILFIDTPDILPFLMIADLIVGDTSSILAEACALQKTIITFKTGSAKRSLSEIDALIKNISWQIDSENHLLPLINQTIHTPDEKKSERDSANRLMFDNLDGKAGKRAADIISSYLPDLLL